MDGSLRGVRCALLVPSLLLACALPRVCAAQTPAGTPAAGPTTTPAQPTPAQPTPTPADEEAARLFAQSVELIDQGRFAEAIVVLERVRALRDTAAVRLNLALAQRGVGQPVQAVENLERYLELAGDRITPERREEVRALLRDTNYRVAYVTLRVTGNAAVTLDAEPVPAARLGTPIPVNPGRHVFGATGEGLRPLEVVRELREHDGLEVTLEPQPLVVDGTLRVEPSESSAWVTVDGHVMGRGPFEGRVAIGEHRVEARAPGYLLRRTTVRVRPGEVTRVTLSLSRGALVSQYWFWVGAAALTTAGFAAGFVALSGTEAPVEGTTLGNAMAIRRRE